MNTLIEQNKSIALRFAEQGWGNVDGWEKVWDELVAEDIVLHFCSWSEPIVELEANKKFNASLFQGFPDIQQTVEDVIAEGNRVVFRATLKGTHTGEFMGIPPTGKQVNVNGINLLRISQGKIVEWWYELNQLEVITQLGALQSWSSYRQKYTIR
ncbi:MAG: ester cyclase [Cyanophyceae cyanobacterium]